MQTRNCILLLLVQHHFTTNYYFRNIPALKVLYFTKLCFSDRELIRNRVTILKEIPRKALV